MYLISIIALIVIMGIAMSMGSGVFVFMDAPSILLVILITGSMLAASGLTKDFIRGFKVMMARENIFSLEELKKALTAVKLVMKLLMASGGLGSIVGIIMLLSRLSEPSEFGPYLAVALLTWFYAILLWVIFLPIKGKLESFIIEKRVE